MSLPHTLGAVVRRHLGAHLHWIPLVTPIDVGDYGLVTGGIFHRIGNVRDLAVDLEVRGSDVAAFSFASADTRRAYLSAGAPINHLGALGSADAEIQVQFSRSGSVYLNAPLLRSESMTDPRHVASCLAGVVGWRHRYRVVQEVLRAEHGTLVSTIAERTTVRFAAAADVLAALELGRLSGDVAVSADKELGLRFVGRSGPLALRLFRVRWWDADPVAAGAGTGEDPVEPSDPAEALPDDV